MRRLIIFCFLLLCIPFGQLRSQGWSFLGPDSIQWRDVSQIDGSFHKDKLPRIVISTSKGMALHSYDRWRYVFPNQGMGNSVLRKSIWVYFSPWNDSVAFFSTILIGAEYPVLYFTRVSNTFRDSVWVFSGIDDCFYSYTGSMTFPRHEINTIYTLLCSSSKSTDNGLTWMFGNFTHEYDNSFFLSSNLSYDSLLYYGLGDPFSIFMSTDRGTTWNSTHVFSSMFSNADLIADGNTLILGTRNWWYLQNACGIYRSTDQGVTWEQKLFFTNVTALVRDNYHPQRLYAATSDGIYFSHNEGNTWQMYNNTLPTKNLNDMIKDSYSDTLYVATDLGVFKVFDKIVTSVKKDIDFPASLSLQQNYPNPFNPTTFIKYTLPSEGKVIFRVFNVLGQEVRKLVDGVEHAGAKSVEFDAKELPSGVYFYSLQAGNFFDVKKMILVR